MGNDADARQSALQARLQQLRSAQGNALEIVSRLAVQTPEEITELLPLLFSTGYKGEEQQALRDTAQAVLQQKLTGVLLESVGTLNGSITKLDASTARLTKVGWWLTVVVGVVGIVFAFFTTR